MESGGETRTTPGWASDVECRTGRRSTPPLSMGAGHRRGPLIAMRGFGRCDAFGAWRRHGKGRPEKRIDPCAVRDLGVKGVSPDLLSSPRHVGLTVKAGPRGLITGQLPD